MDEWGESMEYLEEYGDLEAEEAEAMEEAAAGAQGEAEADAAMAEEAQTTNDIGKLRKTVNILVTERLARQEGEKPAEEWKRSDFANILRRHKHLRKLSTPELRALFLCRVETIRGVEYYRRGTVRCARWRRSVGGWPYYALAVPAPTVYAADNGDADAIQLRDTEEVKLAEIWQNL